jgi:hypothetical protein
MIKVEKDKLYIIMASAMVAFISMNLFSALSFQTDSPTYTYAISVLTGEVQLPEMHYRLAKPLSFYFSGIVMLYFKNWTCRSTNRTTIHMQYQHWFVNV